MNVNYVDAELLSIRFSSLIINASSLDKYKTSIKDFIPDNKIKCTTNGKIVVMYEMNSSHPALSEFATSHLVPIGLEYLKDFVFLQEPMTIGVDGKGDFSKFDQELEETLDIPWLSSICTREGSFVFKASNLPIVNTDFLDKPKEELLELWNTQISNKGWTYSRGVFVADLRNVLKFKEMDTSKQSLKPFRKKWNDDLVVFNNSGQALKVTFPNGDCKILSNIHRVKPNELNLNALQSIKYMIYPSEKSFLFQLNDCDKCVEILVLREGVVVSGTLLIGHVGKDFGQFIFGKEFLIIPFWVNAARTPKGSLVTKHKAINSIDHYHFLMASNGGHSVNWIKYPNYLDSTTVKKGDIIICWDDCELAENPRLVEVPKKGKRYKVREVNPETFGLRLQNLNNPKGSLPVEPGFNLSRFCTEKEWETAPYQMVKNYPHAKSKFLPLGSIKRVYYASSYTVSFDSCESENQSRILQASTPFTALRYKFEELMLNQTLEAYSEFSTAFTDGFYFLIKRTRVHTKDIIGNNIDNTRTVIMLQLVNAISFENHAKAMLLLWLFHDKFQGKNLDEPVTFMEQIDIDAVDGLPIERREIEDLFDFTRERTIHEKVCRLLQI